METCKDSQKQQHSIRVVGSYHLLTFFTEDVQKEFFDITTDPGFEKIFSHSDYKNDGPNFKYSPEECDFELKMTNHGLIRESFWKDSFPPIFTIGEESLKKIIGEENKKNPDKREEAEARIYHYALSNLTEKLGNLGKYEIRLGLNSFGVANFGITLYVYCNENDSFESLCKKISEKSSLLQGDSLMDFKKYICNENNSCIKDYFDENFGNEIKNIERLKPSAFLSYFQVLAIFVIHQFLKEKLENASEKLPDKYYCSCILEKWVRKVYALSKYQWKGLPHLLAKPWDISNKIKNSTRFGLPPMRHVVFMYYLMNDFKNKQAFLIENQKILLALGHNVGWLSDPVQNVQYPPFQSNEKSPLYSRDTSLLENSCCLIFHQGLIVVAPSEDKSLHLGGNESNSVLYFDYWRLIFKLFIRVLEARLMLGVLNQYLFDFHKDFLEKDSKGILYNTFVGHPAILNKIIRIGWVAQRTAGKVITPEISRFSFVRKKLLDFMEGTNFNHQIEHIQSETQKFDNWVNEKIVIQATKVALYASMIAILVTVFQKPIENVLCENLPPKKIFCETKPGDTPKSVEQEK